MHILPGKVSTYPHCEKLPLLLYCLLFYCVADGGKLSEYLDDVVVEDVL